MSEELAKYEGGGTLTAADLRAQVNLIQEVMQAVMKEGTHYGKIPGAGDKPTLLKPGAEKIMATFRFEVDPEVTDLSGLSHYRYRVKCKLNWPSGRFAGAGVGEASTDEEKYKWRSVVSDAEWNATFEADKRIKFRKPYGDNPSEIKQVRTNPADLANTVLKMAKKRALVDAVLTVTAASDIFTQDIEDMPGEYLQGQERKQIHKPQEPPKKAPEESRKSPEGTHAGTLVSIQEKINQKKDSPNFEKPYWAIKHAYGESWTYDPEVAKAAMAAIKTDTSMTWQVTKSNQIVNLQVASMNVPK